MIDYYVIAVAMALTAALYLWLLSGYGMLTRAVDMLGTALVLLFIILLVTAAVLFSYGNEGAANQLSEYAYFVLLAGVVAKAFSLKSEQKGDSP